MELNHKSLPVKFNTIFNEENMNLFMFTVFRMTIYRISVKGYAFIIRTFFISLY